jgi:hypothetical protein
VLSEAAAIDAELPADRQILLLNLPDHVRHAYAFRNALPAAGHVIGYAHTVNAVLDTALAPMTAQQRATYVTSLVREHEWAVFWYAGEGFIALSESTVPRVIPSVP